MGDRYILPAGIWNSEMSLGAIRLEMHLYQQACG
ncbi:hypothetical protein PSYAR_13319 [Pseudomonas syringae pv. aceris str. M302273]|nr:hypothetical protein PSYAR_13319 [Pseudomonas syringae pv. aceris str. M302273]